MSAPQAVRGGQLPMPFCDPIVAALISRDICITHFDGLLSFVVSASADQLTDALALLPEDMRKGRGPVLACELKKRGRA